MPKLLFQQILTLLSFGICGFQIFTQPDKADTWLQFIATLIAYWLPSPSINIP